MSPRYKKPNRRYKVNVPKEKMSFEKRTKIQSVSSVILLAVFTIYSFIGPTSFVSRCLDTTYSWDMWCSLAGKVASTIKTKTASVANSYLSFIDSAEKKMGIAEPTAPTVKAEKTKPEPKSQKQKTQPQVPAQVQRNWYVPAKGEITSYFGNRIHPVTGKEDFHKGVDIGAPKGEAVTAASEGSVLATGSDSYSGNFVILDHGEDITSVYAHLDTISVAKNDKVKKDTQIGTVGSTGVSTGPHLHFEIRISEESINPLSFVRFEER